MPALSTQFQRPSHCVAVGFSVVLLGFQLGCRSSPINAAQSGTTPVALANVCPQELTGLMPSTITERAVIHVRAMFEDPTLGEIIRHALDSQSERVLLRRAERYGYELRTLDRVAIGWAPDGTTLFFAHGAIDANAIAERLYNELLHPRRHAIDRARNERVEGPLRQLPVALLARPSCALVAYAEGPTGALVDRALGTVRSTEHDSGALFWWTTRRQLRELPPTGAALLRYVQKIEVTGDLAESGVAVRVNFSGTLPNNAELVLRATIAELAASAFGSLCGAQQWAAGERLTITQSTGELQASVVVPWGAIREGIGVLQGRY